MPWWSDQFCDANGDPLASGTVETYAAGTSTPLATYSDAALSVSNGTTLTLNSGGYPEVTGVEVGVYLLPRAYKFILKNSAGVVVRTRDNVYANQPASSVNLEIDGIAGVALSANDCVYLSDGSGGLTDGRWYKADADFTYASTAPIVGFVTSAIAQGATGTIRRGGIMDGFAGLTAGDTYYISATAGAITATAPTNARVVGVASSATTIVLAIDSVPSAGVTQPLNIAEGRLTGTTATPVTTADVTGATSIFYTPYKGNRIALYDGTSTWNVRTFTEITISLAGLTASKPYDVFAYDNAGVVTIETLVWTSASVRATALTTQNGVLVKTGVTTRRYLGTIYINGSGGQTDDSYLKRNIYNYYNRVTRPMRAVDTANTWTYTLNAWQQANANAANQLEVMVGWAESAVRVTVIGQGSNGALGNSFWVGIGEDSTTATATGCIRGQAISNVVGYVQMLTASLDTIPAVGRHTYTWLERSEAANTTTWYGDNGSTLLQTGISGVTEG